MKSSVFSIVSAVVALALLIGAGFALEGPINAADFKAKTNGYRTIVQSAEGFSEIEGFGDKAKEYNAAVADAYRGATVDECFAVLDGAGNTNGYVFRVNSPSGYSGNLTVLLYIKDGAVAGYAPSVMNESQGFGAKCVSAEFIEKMAGVASPDEVDGISGATITTKAIKDIVGTALDFTETYLEGQGAPTE